MSSSLHYRGKAAPHEEQQGLPKGLLNASAGCGDWRYLPSRLRRLMADPTFPIRARACRDVVVRVPIAHFSEKDIMNIIQSYGAAEYVSRGGVSQGKLVRAMLQRSFEVGGAVQMEAEAEGDGLSLHCHIVRFEEGEDAIRCVMHLNGLVLESRSIEEDMELLSQWAAEERQAEDTNDEEAQLWQDLETSLKQRENRQLHSEDSESTNVVITCDFFRSAFAESLGDARQRILFTTPTVRRRKATQSKVQFFFNLFHKRRQTQASTAQGGNPTVLLFEALKRASIEWDRVYLAQQATGAQHKIPWQYFMFVVNYISFFVSREEGSGTGSVWEVTTRVLDKGQDDVETALSWVDAADSQEQLWNGSVEEPQKSGTSQRALRNKDSKRKGRRSMLLPHRSVQAVIGLGALLLFALLLWLLM